MTLQRLIDELEKIKREYGNLPVKYENVNIDSGEATFIEITEILIFELLSLFSNDKPFVVLR